jgi:DNA replication protein DnaC
MGMDNLNKHLDQLRQRIKQPPASSSLASAKPKPQVCDYCGGVQWYRYDVPLGHPFFGTIYPCPKCNSAAIEAECGLLSHERRITLANLIVEDRPGAQAMAWASQIFIDNPKGFLSFHGTYGNGKTIAAQAIVNAMVDRGVVAKYCTASDLMGWLREAFSDQIMETDTARIRRLATIPVLVIDEMDKLRDTPYSREVQQELLNLRYRDAGSLGTVLVWNGDLWALPWPAVVSRLQEFPIIENFDPDLRPEIGKARQA